MRCSARRSPSWRRPPSPYLHVFPYSERPGTPAARMPPVPAPVRRERAARLRAAAAGFAASFHAGQVGQVASVLAERGGAGHTEHFAPVRIDAAPGHPAAGAHPRRRRGRAGGGGGLMALGFFSRLKEGLSRSTQKADGRPHRVLHQAHAGRCGAGGAGGAAARRRSGAASGIQHRREFPPQPLRPRCHGRRGEAVAGGGDRRHPRPRGPAAGHRPGASPACRAGRGVNGTGKTTTIGKLALQYREQGAASDAGGRRHLPRRGRRAVAGLGRAHRRPGDRRAAECGCRGPGVRRAGAGAGGGARTCC